MARDGAKERRSKAAVGVSAQRLRRDAGRPLVAVDHSRHDARGSSRTYKEFLECYEGIATNILADRLRKLAAYGIIATEPDPTDGRKVIYLLTAKGIDLAPVLTEMVLWAAAHEETGNQALVRQMRSDKEKFLAGVRQRWAGRRSPQT